MKIAVVGACGKLGSLIVKTLQHNKYVVISVDTKLNNFLNDYSNINAVIDASHPDQSVICAKYCNQHNIPLLVACTGHTSQQLNNINTICANIAYCICPNLCVGINFIMQILKHITMLPTQHICITETHHVNKKDSPSGTAIMLKKQIEKFTNKNVYICSVRKEDVVGVHTINIILPNEEITITHKANNREIFAEGAYYAITKLLSVPSGKYNIEDLFGE